MDVNPSQLPELVAHRGYAHAYPENTLLAIEQAVNAGARYVEFDVLLSRDGVPVLFHDRDLLRMCQRQGAIHEYSYQELKTFSVYEPDKFGERFMENRISSLAEVVDYIAGNPQLTAFVELKRQGLAAHGMDDFLDQVLPLLKPVETQSVVISYSLEALMAMRRRSSLPIGAVFDHWHEHDNDLIEQLNAEYWFTDINELPETGRLDCPARLAVYECTDPNQAMAMHARGVELVETFQIKEMLEAFQRMDNKPGYVSQV